MATNRFQDISIKKVGAGSFYQAGKLGGQFRRRGLAGALRSAKAGGKFTYAKNLSNKDLEKFQAVVGTRLARLAKHSEGFSLRTRREIMAEFERMRKAGEISATDKDDFRHIVAALSAGGKKQSVSSKISHGPKQSTQRAISFTNNKTNQKSDLKTNVQTNVASTGKMSIAQEAASKRRLSSLVKSEAMADSNQFESNQNKFQAKKYPNNNQDNKSEDRRNVIAKRDNLAPEDKGKVIELDIG